MINRPPKKKPASPAPRRPDPTARPKAVIDGVAKEIDPAKPATGKAQAKAPAKPATGKGQAAKTDKPAARAPEGPAKPARPGDRQSQRKTAPPGTPPGPAFGQLAGAGAIGAALVIAAMLVLAYGSDTTGGWLAEISGAGPVNRQLVVARGEIVALRQQLDEMRARTDAQSASVNTALETQARRIAGLDALRRAQATTGDTLQSLARDLDESQQKTERIAQSVASLDGRIGKVRQTVDKLAALPRPAGGTVAAAAPTGSPDTARLSALEGSVASLSAALAGITTDLAQLSATVETIDAPGGDQRARVSEIALQVKQASQRIATIDENLNQLAAKTELAGVSIYYQAVADRVRRGAPFEGALKLLVTALGAPNPQLAALAATGVPTRDQLLRSLRALIEAQPQTTPRPPDAPDTTTANTGWFDRLLARASRAIVISKTGAPAPGMPGVPGATDTPGEDTLTRAGERLAAGDLDAAMALVAQAGDGADLRAWLARARALGTAEKALETLKAQVDAAIDRGRGEAS